jgi:flagellum-specific ATP synthase
VLERGIAERGRYPAINVLRSMSRTMPACNDRRERDLILRARTLMSAYDDMEEMIRLGAYRPGSDPRTGQVIKFHEPLEAFLYQDKEDGTDIASGCAMLEQILGEGAQ